MIEPDHHCAWTRRHRSRLSWNGEHWSAAGIPRAVIVAVASRLGHTLTEEPDPSDEYGALLTIGPWRIHVHDDCFLRFDSADAFLREAFLQATVELHECYLGTSIGPAGVALIRAHLRDGVTLELRSDSRRGEFQVKYYFVTAGSWERHGAPVERVAAEGADQT